MSYRPAADLLEQMFPVYAAKHSETARRQALKVGEALQDCAVIAPGTMASGRGDAGFDRLSGVARPVGGRFLGAIAKAGTGIKALINRNLDAVVSADETLPTSNDRWPPLAFARERWGRPDHSGGPDCMDQG